MRHEQLIQPWRKRQRAPGGGAAHPSKKLPQRRGRRPVGQFRSQRRGEIALGKFVGDARHAPQKCMQPRKIALGDERRGNRVAHRGQIPKAASIKTRIVVMRHDGREHARAQLVEHAPLRARVEGRRMYRPGDEARRLRRKKVYRGMHGILKRQLRPYSPGRFLANRTYQIQRPFAALRGHARAHDRLQIPAAIFAQRGIFVATAARKRQIRPCAI